MIYFVGQSIPQTRLRFLKQMIGMEEDSEGEEEGIEGGVEGGDGGGGGGGGKSGKGKEKEWGSTGRGTVMKERRGAISRGQGVGAV